MPITLNEKFYQVLKNLKQYVAVATNLWRQPEQFPTYDYDSFISSHWLHNSYIFHFSDFYEIIKISRQYDYLFL